MQALEAQEQLVGALGTQGMERAELRRVGVVRSSSAVGIELLVVE